MPVSSRPQPSLRPFQLSLRTAGLPQLALHEAVPRTPTIALTSAPCPASPRVGRTPGQAPHFPWGATALGPCTDRPSLLAPLQTRTSAPRTTAAASRTASTPSAATSASVAAASSSTTTSMTARKVSGRAPKANWQPENRDCAEGSEVPSPSASVWTQEAEWPLRSPRFAFHAPPPATSKPHTLLEGSGLWLPTRPCCQADLVTSAPSNPRSGVFLFQPPSVREVSWDSGEELGSGARLPGPAPPLSQLWALSR